MSDMEGVGEKCENSLYIKKMHLVVHSKWRVVMWLNGRMVIVVKDWNSLSACLCDQAVDSDT